MKTMVISILVSILSVPTIAQNFWQQSNFPSFYSGEINSIDARNNIVIASSYQDGLAISTNGGDNWFPTFTTNSHFYSVAISKSGYLYAIGSDGVLYRSVNKGITWDQSSTNFYCNGPQIISCTNGYLYIGSYQGIFRSIDEGVNWTLQNNGLIVGGSSPFTRIESSSTGILVVATPSGVFKSTNNADSWVRVSPIGASNVAVNSLGYIFSNRYRESPYLHSDTLYRTTNNGVSWQPLRRWGGAFIFISPADDAIALADYNYTANYFLSTDYGITWTSIISEKSPVCMSYNGYGKYFMEIYELGIFSSNSLSGSWHPFNSGFPGSGTEVSSIISNSGKLIAGTHSFGLFSSTNNGITFSKISPLHIDKLAATSNAYIFGLSGAVGRSTDLGITWTWPQSGALYDLYSYSLYSNGSIVLTGGSDYFESAELDRSIDNGETWNKVYSINGAPGALEYKVIALAINTDGTALGCIEKRHKINPPLSNWNYSYAIIRSTDFGVFWSTSDFIYYKINNFSWNNSNVVYAATTHGLLKSEDDGLTWNNATNALPTLDLQSIVIDSNDNIYIGTGNTGVIFSSDNGEYWTTLNDGITDTIIHTLCISDEGYLFAGGEHDGVFRSADPINPEITPPAKLPNIYELFQNYPNPFNPVTKIKYSIPSVTLRQAQSDIEVTLKVYDILGREIAILVNEKNLRVIIKLSLMLQTFQAEFIFTGYGSEILWKQGRWFY